ncbi:MAG TPA: hypothetical protein VE913_24645 [Longimicrobium sp.]|nr:hypothetical protein [Longimicrobium sp.]
MRLPQAVGLVVLALATAACDPNYCGVVYGTVRTAAGAPVPDSTKLLFYYRAPPLDTATYREPPLDSTFTRADGRYEHKFKLFIQSLSYVGIRTLGTDTVARMRSSVRCGNPPRTRVNIIVTSAKP